MVILSADDWVCGFALCVVQMRHPAPGAAGGWVMQGLVLRWLRGGSHYLILPSASSLLF